MLPQGGIAGVWHAWVPACSPDYTELRPRVHFKHGQAVRWVCRNPMRGANLSVVITILTSGTRAANGEKSTSMHDTKASQLPWQTPLSVSQDQVVTHQGLGRVWSLLVFPWKGV